LLDDVAGCESEVIGEQLGHTWGLSVAVFRAADQRCKLILESGVSEDWSNNYCPEDGAAPVEFGDHHSTMVTLDVLQVVSEGLPLTDGLGRPWFVLAEEDEL
jgi:hypothetical protein